MNPNSQFGGSRAATELSGIFSAVKLGWLDLCGASRDLVSCPALLFTTTGLAGTPSPGPPRLTKAPAAAHPLPQGGEGLGSKGILSGIMLFVRQTQEK